MYSLDRYCRLAVILLAVSCGLAKARAEDRKPNFVFLLADDQRADTLSAFGNSRISTPNLDSLVARGMSFSRATCSCPICHVSRAEILTGTHGWENGYYGGPGGGKLREDRLTWWPATLAKSGYQTFFVGKWHTPGSVLDRGFQKTRGFFKGGGGKWWKDQKDWKGFPITGYRGWVFQDPVDGRKFPEKGVGLTPDISSLFADAAIELLRKDRIPGTPFFLSVSFTAPHDPLFIPSGQEGKYHAKIWFRQKITFPFTRLTTETLGVVTKLSWPGPGRRPPCVICCGSTIQWWLTWIGKWAGFLTHWKRRENWTTPTSSTPVTTGWLWAVTV